MVTHFSPQRPHGHGQYFGKDQGRGWWMGKGGVEGTSAIMSTLKYLIKKKDQVHKTN